MSDLAGASRHLARLAKACVDNDAEAMWRRLLVVEQLYAVWVSKHGSKAVTQLVNQHAISAWREMNPTSARECFVSMCIIWKAFHKTPSDDFFDEVLLRFQTAQRCAFRHEVEEIAGRAHLPCPVALLVSNYVRTRVSDRAAAGIGTAMCSQCIRR